MYFLGYHQGREDAEARLVQRHRAARAHGVPEPAGGAHGDGPLGPGARARPRLQPAPARQAEQTWTVTK